MQLNHIYADIPTNYNIHTGWFIGFFSLISQKSQESNTLLHKFPHLTFLKMVNQVFVSGMFALASSDIFPPSYPSVSVF